MTSFYLASFSAPGLNTNQEQKESEASDWPKIQPIKNLDLFLTCETLPQSFTTNFYHSSSTS